MNLSKACPFIAINNIAVNAKKDEVWVLVLDFTFYDGSNLKTYLYIRGLEPYVVSVIRPVGV